MATTERIIEGLPEQTQKLLQAYSKDVKSVYDDQLEGLILYGSAVRGEFMPGRSNLNLLLVVIGYDAAMLKRYEPVHKRWSKEGIIIPLFLTDQEIRTSSALFPLEFLEIQEHHRVLGGRDPFVGFHVDVSRVADAVMQLLPLAVTSTVPLLRGIQRMRGWPVLTQSDAVIKDVADRLQIDLQGLHEALMLKRGIISPGPSEVPRVFDRYVKATTMLSEALHR